MEQGFFASISNWWASLASGARKAAIGIGVIMLLVLGSCIFSEAEAVEPGWYAPDDNGEGLIVRCGTAGCGFVWLTHAKGGQLWLISTSNCAVDASVCDIEMAQTTGTWRGLVGETEIAEPTVQITVSESGTGVSLEWNARALFPDSCFDVGSGGLILRGCIGRKEFGLLAR